VLLRLLLATAPGLMIGSPLGQAALYSLPIDTVRQCLGAVCLVVVIERAIKPLRDRRAAIGPDVDSAALPREDMSPRRMSAAALTGLVAGVLGAALGTSGVPVMVFIAYFPLRKGTTRNLVCCLGWPTQVYALVSFSFHDDLNLGRDWLLLCVVVIASSAGVWLGDRWHQRLPTAAIGWGVLLFLSLVAIQMIAQATLPRLALSLALLALGAYVALVQAVDAAAAVPEQQEPAVDMAPADVAPWMNEQNIRAAKHRALLRLGVAMGLVSGRGRRAFGTSHGGHHRRLCSVGEPQPIDQPISEVAAGGHTSVAQSSASHEEPRQSDPTGAAVVPPAKNGGGTVARPTATLSRHLSEM